MSHKATNWAIQQRGLTPAAKLVLWHLCDRHNPDLGCFPSQERLAHDCELSRSTLNEHLGTLEERGLIARHRRRGAGNRQIETSYTFAFEEGFEAPAKADESEADKAESRVRNPDTETGIPSPEKGDFRVRISGDSVSGQPDSKPVREPVSEPLSDALRAGEREGDGNLQEEVRPDADDPRTGPAADTIDRQWWRLVNGWPDLGGMPKQRAFRAFSALSAEDRLLALERRDAWMATLKAAKRAHVPGPYTYCAERLFLDVEAAPAQGTAKPVLPAYGKAWMAHRLWLLDNLPPHEWKPPAMMARWAAEGREDLVAGPRRRGKHPQVARLDDDAKAGRGAMLREGTEAPDTEHYARVAKGSAEWLAWEAWHHARDWPWIDPPKHVVWVHVPAQWPEGAMAERLEA